MIGEQAAQHSSGTSSGDDDDDGDDDGDTTELDSPSRLRLAKDNWGRFDVGGKFVQVFVDNIFIPYSL